MHALHTMEIMHAYACTFAGFL